MHPRRYVAVSTIRVLLPSKVFECRLKLDSVLLPANAQQFLEVPVKHGLVKFFNNDKLTVSFRKEINA